MHGRFGEPRNAENRARRGNFWKIFGKNRVQFTVLMDVFQIDLDVDDVIHRKARCFDHASHIVEALANLLRKICRHGPIRAMRALSGNIHIVSRVHAGGAGGITGNRHLLRHDGSQLSLRRGGEGKERRNVQEQHLHAAFPLRAAPRIVRSLCPTIISSPG